jgi:flavin reductase (DIM6/NTAB) family NADH-FMN oxidoreductase RutF
MIRKAVPYTFQFEETMRQLGGDGLLLAATRSDGESNVMAIGWGNIGIIWGRPIFIVLVRPSRYTFQFIEESGEFTVNVPTPEMSDQVLYCGTESGRDGDKFSHLGLSVTPGQTVKTVTLDDCPLVYECRVVQKNDVLPDTFDPAIPPDLYPQGDYHRVYFGEIMGTFSSR